MLLSCIGQRSLSNSGVLESLLNLLDNLLSPLQPELSMHRRTEGIIEGTERLFFCLVRAGVQAVHHHAQLFVGYYVDSAVDISKFSTFSSFPRHISRPRVCISHFP